VKYFWPVGCAIGEGRWSAQEGVGRDLSRALAQERQSDNKVEAVAEAEIKRCREATVIIVSKR
jgi:hypothetical protein